LTFTVRSNAQRTSIAVRKFLSRRSVYRGREGLKGERESWKKPTNLIGQIDEGHLALLTECEEKREGGREGAAESSYAKKKEGQHFMTNGRASCRRSVRPTSPLMN
jgi:hypothetical protein